MVAVAIARAKSIRVVAQRSSHGSWTDSVDVGRCLTQAPLPVLFQLVTLQLCITVAVVAFVRSFIPCRESISLAFYFQVVFNSKSPRIINSGFFYPVQVQPTDWNYLQNRIFDQSNNSITAPKHTRVWTKSEESSVYFRSQCHDAIYTLMRISWRL